MISIDRLIKEVCCHPPGEDVLDSSQCEAIAHALTHEVAIIQGPPGCGKTRTGITLLRILLSLPESHRTGPVLVLAQRNRAVDDLLTKLMEFVSPKDVCRLGRICDEHREFLPSLRSARLVSPLRRDPAFLEMLDLKRSIGEKRFSGLTTAWNIVYRRLGEFPYRLERWVKTVSLPLLFLLRSGTFPPDCVSDGEKLGYWLLGRPTPLLPAESKLDWISSYSPYKESPHREDPDLFEPLRNEMLRILQQDLPPPDWLEFHKTLCQVRNLDAQLEEIDNRMKGKILSRIPLIAATLTHANMNKEILELARPCAVLIEEAAEVLDPLVLNALPSSVCHVIFIGDPQQLQPRVQVPKLSPLGFGASPMTRLLALGLPTVQLRYQNRMLPELALPLTIMYPRLKNGHLASSHPRVPGLLHSLFWWDMIGPEKVSPRYSNKREADAILELVRLFCLLGVSRSDIAILTPYKEQESLIQRTLWSSLPRNACKELTLSTVDSFQGLERRVVLLSLVRSNRGHAAGFLKDPGRRCVSLSRAQSALFIVGDSRTVSTAHGWKDILSSFRLHSQLNPTLIVTCPEHRVNVAIPSICLPLKDSSKSIPKCICQAYPRFLYQMPPTSLEDKKIVSITPPHV